MIWSRNSTTQRLNLSNLLLPHSTQVSTWGNISQLFHPWSNLHFMSSEEIGQALPVRKKVGLRKRKATVGFIRCSLIKMGWHVHVWKKMTKNKTEDFPLWKSCFCFTWKWHWREFRHIWHMQPAQVIYDVVLLLRKPTPVKDSFQLLNCENQQKQPESHHHPHNLQEVVSCYVVSSCSKSFHWEYI